MTDPLSLHLRTIAARQMSNMLQKLWAPQQPQQHGAQASGQAA
jgi:hypothetical protein